MREYGGVNDDLACSRGCACVTTDMERTNMFVSASFQRVKSIAATQKHPKCGCVAVVSTIKSLGGLAGNKRTPHALVDVVGTTFRRGAYVLLFLFSNSI